MSRGDFVHVFSFVTKKNVWLEENKQNILVSFKASGVFKEMCQKKQQ